MSNYQATYCSLQNLRLHPNADKLQIADAMGYNVIVSTNMKEGDVGIVIPAGSQLSMDFCLGHKLLRKHPNTGESLGGYLDPSRRVRAMTMRDIESEALFVSMKLDVEEGQELESIPGYDHFVCKYETPSQVKEKKIKEQSSSPPKKKDKIVVPKHYDTKHLRGVVQRLQEEFCSPGTVTVITEKVHGTSGRTACALSVPSRIWNFLTPRFLNISPQFRTGTRNTLIGENSTGMRKDIHDYFSTKLKPGETVYYEIAGFNDKGRPIMSNHSLKKAKGYLSKAKFKEMKEKYGETIVYKYRCSCNGAPFPDLAQYKESLIPRYRVFVYRITQDGKELTYSQMEKRMEDLGWASYVSLVPKLTMRGTWFNILETATDLANGPSFIDPSHPIEGVCVRLDGKVGGKAYKHKGFLFLSLEGAVADDPNFVDEEDIS